jgi:hypothetical protein
MTTITDEQLYSHAERVRGTVVVITGDFYQLSMYGSGTGLISFTQLRWGQRVWQTNCFAFWTVRVCSYFIMSLEVDRIYTPTSAKVVIGDLDVSAAEEVITEIVKAGG